MAHTHVIDGKLVTFDDATCPICHPELPQQQQKQRTATQPTVYTKGHTVVLKISRATVMTLNYWSEGNAFLLTISRMLRDQNGRALRDEKGQPKWHKLTVRMNKTILQQFLTEASKLINTLNQQTVNLQRQ